MKALLTQGFFIAHCLIKKQYLESSDNICKFAT